MPEPINSVTATYHPTQLPAIAPQFDSVAAETRKCSIEQCLGAAVAMTVLPFAELICEWIKLTAALKSVSAQPEEKPKGGRPRSGASEAARKLPLPGNQSESARRQFISRAMKIAKIFDRAKSVAKEEKLDDNQTALLAIASEETEEAQVEIARSWKRRNRRGHLAPGDTDAYTVTSLDHLNEDERHGIDQILDGLTMKFGVVVKHVTMATKVPIQKGNQS